MCGSDMQPVARDGSGPIPHWVQVGESVFVSCLYGKCVCEGYECEESLNKVCMCVCVYV